MPRLPATVSTRTLVRTKAVNIDTATPTVRVIPKPLTAPEAKKNSRTAAMTVVALESAMALHALAKPERTARRTLRPAACSSLARSKTNTLASTAMPMANTKPAIPGRVSVASRASSTA
jgi:hypothetical protein